jgi:HK97 family phage portal protein
VFEKLYRAQEGSKAFPYTMELTDLGGPLIGSGVGFYGSSNPYVPDANALYSRSNTPLSQREALVHGQVFGGAEPVDWIMDALNFTIQAASSTMLHFEDAAGAEFKLKKSYTDPADTKLVDPILAKLFDMPNPYQPWDTFLETTLIDFFLVGNAYWVKWGNPEKPVALYRMAPEYVRIIPDRFGPSKYLYRLPGVAQEISFTPDQVLHFKRPNPHDPYYGLGLIKGAARAVDMELALTGTAAAYYEQAAIPTGVVQTERRVPRDVFNKLKAQLQGFYGGSSNAGKLLVLEAGLQFTAVSPTAASALFNEMGAWSRDRILAMFNMNACLLGIGDAADGGEVSGWQQLFDRKTMIPLLGKFGKAISRGLTQPGWGLDVCFDYEETQSPEEVINRANAYAKLPGVKVKELRAAANLPPSTGDPNIDELVLNLPGPNLDATGRGGFADRNLPGEPGRPPLPENTRVIGLGSTGPAGGNAAALPAGKAMTLADLDGMIAQMSDRAAALAGQKALPPARVHVGEISSLIPPEDRLHSTRTMAVDALAAGARNEILKAVHSLERGLLDSAEGKAQGTIYMRVKNSKAWTAFRQSLEASLEAMLEQAYSLSNVHHANAGLEALEADFAQLAKDQSQRPEGAAGIVKTFKAEVMQQILRMQRSGTTQAEVNKAIQEATAKWTAGRALNVAVNEATIAYNHGTALVADANGLNVLVSDGEDFDEPCAEANGQVWTTQYALDHLQQHPNCRRGFVPVATPAS